MKTLTVTYVRRHFFEVIREVEQGEEITITRRGKPIARITPEPQTTADQH